MDPIKNTKKKFNGKCVNSESYSEMLLTSFPYPVFMQEVLMMYDYSLKIL